MKPMHYVIALPIMALALFLGVAVFGQQPVPEPLADPTSLRMLIAGQELPEPKDATQGVFHGLIVNPPSLASLKQASRVLGTTNSADKRIEVDLTNQRVYAYEGDTRVFTFIVSTGKWGPTPTGTFYIWAKVRSQAMSGGNPNDGTYYYLPNIPYVQFFYNDEVEKSRGFSFHGTYWHNNFGHPMSHGCVNMRSMDAKTLYDWSNPVVTDPKAWSTHPTADNPGTKVVIYGEAPNQ